MKKEFFVVVFVLVSMTMFGQETNGQAMNRARNFAKEWNSLVDMHKILTGEARIRLCNYMMGFAEGAYRLCEEFSNAGYREFSYNANFFFQVYQMLVGQVGGRTPNFFNFYYKVGFERSEYGGSRLGINDFR
jgi:hypothetical protein